MPTQLGRHFWPEFAYLTGLRLDYLSPTLYLTDLLIIILFFVWMFDFVKKRSDFQFSTPLLLVVFLGVGVLFSKNIGAGVYGLIKFLEFLFFGFYVALKVKELRLMTEVFSIGLIFESLLAILQFVNQGSLGSFLYFFGERTFSSQTPGIANASLNGQLVLRPYGTLPHPNVLAGYLTIAMAMVISNFKFHPRPELGSKAILNFKKIIFLLSLVIGSIALLLTMSRVAIILWVLIVFYLFFCWLTRFKNFKANLYYLLFAVIILFLFIFSPLRFRFFDFSLSDQSVSVRFELIKSSLWMIKENPVFGVGLNNFLVNLPSFQKNHFDSIFESLQPVHNLYLLIATETGIIGLGIFLWFVIASFKKLIIHNLEFRTLIFLCLIVILTLGFFDHYFWTLQQGRLLLTLVLGLAWVNPL